MRPGFKRMMLAVAFLGAGVYAAYTLNGPRGIPGFLERQEEIRRLQTRNADLERENQRKREQIKQLGQKDGPELDLAFRERLKKQRKGEKTFVIGPPKTSGSPALDNTK